MTIKNEPEKVIGAYLGAEEDDERGDTMTF